MSECLKNPAVLILFLCQALGVSVAVMMIAIGGTVGLELSGSTRWSTLPITFYVFGTFSMLFPASMICGLWGRKWAFIFGASLGVLGGVLFYYGVIQRMFWLVCVGTVFVGMQRSFIEYYRFAVAELVSEKAKAFAMSLVVGGGVLAAIFAPWLAKNSRVVAFDNFFPHNFSASALAIGGLCLLQVLLFLFYRPAQNAASHPSPHAKAEAPPIFPPNAHVASNYLPYIMMAVMVAGAGFALMTLLMNAAPVAMQHEFHLNFDHAVSAIRWHVLAMFVPSFFTGFLIKKFGVFFISFAGLSLLLFSSVSGIQAQDHMQFVVALILLGVGWNFCYLAGSYLIVLATPLPKKSLIEGVSNSAIYTMNLLGSFLAGVSLAWGGWETLNIWVTGFIVILLGVAIVKRRTLNYDQKFP